MNRQRLTLFILVILFGIAVLWSYSAIPRPKTVSNLTFKPGQQAKQVKQVVAATDKPASDADDGSSLKISLLEKEPAGFKGYRRNIFKPVFVDELKVAKQMAMAIKPPPKVSTVPVQPVIVQPVQPTQPESAPLARFTFLGFLKKGSVKTIFLAKDKDILLVKKGDKVAGRYEAIEISDQALTLTVSDTGDEIVIPLVENRPLAPAK
jgi:hypothetical protein